MLWFRREQSGSAALACFSLGGFMLRLHVLSWKICSKCKLCFNVVQKNPKPRDKTRIAECGGGWDRPAQKQKHSLLLWICRRCVGESAAQQRLNVKSESVDPDFWELWNVRQWKDELVSCSSVVSRSNNRNSSEDDQQNWSLEQNVNVLKTSVCRADKLLCSPSLSCRQQKRIRRTTRSWTL